MGELELKVKLDTNGAKTGLQDVQREVAQTKSSFKSWNDGLEELVGNLREIANVTANAFSRMVESTQRVDDHNQALQHLGDAYELVRQRTNDAVTAEQAQRVQQELTQAGYRVTGQQLATITARAREYAQANGTDLNQALQQVTGTLRGLSQEGLGHLGVRLDHAATRGDAFRQAVGQMETQLHSTGISAQSLGEGADVLRRNWTAMQDGIIARISGWLNLGTAIQGVNDILDGTFARMQRANGMTGHDDAAGREAAANRLNTAGARQYFGANDLGRLNTHDAHQVAWYVEHGDIEGARRAMGTGQAARDTQNTTDAARLTGGEATPVGASADRIRMPSTGSPAHHEMSAADVRAQMLLDIQKAEDTAARIALDSEQAANDNRLDEQQRADAELLAARQTAFEAAGEAEQKAMDESAAARANTLATMLDDERKHAQEINSVRTQLDQRFAQHAELNQTTAQNLAGVVEGTYNTMTGALKTHISAVIQGKEDIGTALKSTLQEILLNLAAESATKAIMETAMGFAALARGVGSYGADAGAVVSAPMHFTSAAMFAGIALGAGAGYAGVSAIGAQPAGAGAGFGGAPGAAASTRGPGSATAGGEGGGNVYNFNVNGFAATNEGVHAAIGAAVEAHIAGGNRIRGLQHAA